MKNNMIIIMTILLVSALASVAIGQNKGPASVEFTPKMGTVTFNHEAHQAATDCASCHHTGDYASCKSCHGVDPKAPKTKKAFHGQCISCHKTAKQGPTKCKECHIK